MPGFGARAETEQQLGAREHHCASHALWIAEVRSREERIARGHERAYGLGDRGEIGRRRRVGHYLARGFGRCERSLSRLDRTMRRVHDDAHVLGVVTHELVLGRGFVEHAASERRVGQRGGERITPDLGARDAQLTIALGREAPLFAPLVRLPVLEQQRGSQRVPHCHPVDQAARNTRVRIFRGRRRMRRGSAARGEHQARERRSRVHRQL